MAQGKNLIDQEDNMPLTESPESYTHFHEEQKEKRGEN